MEVVYEPGTRLGSEVGEIPLMKEPKGVTFLSFSNLHLSYMKQKLVTRPLLAKRSSPQTAQWRNFEEQPSN